VLTDEIDRSLMALDPSAVGATSEPVEVRWSRSDALLYALAVGAGVDDLAFTTENTAGVAQRALPTFAAVIGFNDGTFPGIGDVAGTQALHARQSVVLHRPLEPEGVVTLHRQIVAMYDKESAAIVVYRTLGRDRAGDAWFTSEKQLFYRGAGGFGGERGPQVRPAPQPDRQPEVEVTFATHRDQALWYRLTGDRNPLHSDPQVAAAAGFAAPILHGMCTYGIAVRLLVQACCAADPTVVVSVDARFASPVTPGEPLSLRAWRDGRRIQFDVSVGDRIVIDQGVVALVG
jgi:acyl dehydratase